MKNLISGVTYTNRESAAFDKYLTALTERERLWNVQPKVIKDVRAVFEREQIYLILIGGAEAEKAKERLFVANQRFVVSLSNAALVDGVEQMDLINVGNVALWECIENLREMPSCSFASFVKKNIQGAMTDIITEIKGVVKRPRSKCSVLNEYRRLTENIQDPDFDFEHYIDVMCENPEVFEMARRNVIVCSMDENLSDGEDDYTLHDVLFDDEYEHSFEVNSREYIIETIHDVANLFEANVFIALYGLDGNFHTRDMICNEFGINQQQLYYIDNKVLNLLQQNDVALELHAIIA